MQKFNKTLLKNVIFTCLLCAGLLFSKNVQAETAYTTEDGVWDYKISAGEAVIGGYHHPSGTTWDVVIPETITHEGKNYPVTEIYGYTFKTLALTSVKIPAGVKTIGDYAFQGCTAMTKVTFAENSKLETVGAYAFGQTAITEIEIPASVKTLGDQVFNGSDGLTSVTFEEGSKLETIGNSAFSTCAIAQITLPSGLKTIGNNAFAGQPLTSIIIPKTVTTIGDGAFSTCKSLTSVTFEKVSQLENIGQQAFTETQITALEIPASVKTIGNKSFQNCASLETVTFEEGSALETIGNGAFSRVAIKEISIPSSCTTIGDDAFEYCTALETFTIPEDSKLESIGTFAFSGANAIKSFYFPPSLKSIGANAFRFTNVTSFEFSEGLETIGAEAFVGNDMTMVVLPQSLTTIGDGVFTSCSDLKVVYHPADLDISNALGTYQPPSLASYTVSDDVPPVVTITFPENATGEFEIPTSIPGAEDAQIKVGDIPVLPTSYSTDCRTTVLSQLAAKLPTGYSFETPAAKIPAGETTECTAVYTSNGMTYKFTTKIVVAAHEENKTLLYTGEGEKEVTCTENGLAHTECDICDATITGNIIIEATGHQTTEIRDAKTPTCTEKGYTGDTWCIDCKAKIESGKEIAMKEHTWDGGVVAKQPTRLEKGVKTFTCKACQATKTEDIPSLGAHAKGIKLPDDKNQGFYKVTKAGLTGGTVEYVKPLNKNKKTVSIPATVKIDGITYKVTSIAKNAFKNNKSIKKLTIGTNVSKIGAKAFFGCKNLKTITIKTTKLKNKKVGVNAFKGIKSKATIKVPKKKYNAYKKLLMKKGVGNKAVFKKLK